MKEGGDGDRLVYKESGEEIGRQRRRWEGKGRVMRMGKGKEARMVRVGGE